jgi:hypothetical protein
MTEEQSASLVKSVERIELALLGDEAMGQTGLIKNQKDHAKRITRIESWGTTLITAGGLLTVAYKVIVDWWPKK